MAQKRKADQITSETIIIDDSSDQSLIEIPKAVSTTSNPILKKAKTIASSSQSFQTKLQSFFLHSNSDTLLPKSRFILGDGKLPQNKIKIASWNVNGLKAVMKRGDLIYYLNQEKPDIICLSEIRISEFDLEKEKSLEYIQKLGYFCYYNCCTSKSGYSGTAIMTKYKPISIKLGFGGLKHDVDGRVITADFEKFYLVSCYAPNLSSEDRIEYRIKEWDPDLRNFLDGLKAVKSVVLAGDLNVTHQPLDLGKTPWWKNLYPQWETPWRKNFSDFLESGWVDTFRKMKPGVVKYSHFDPKLNGRVKNIGSRVDYFVVTKEMTEAVNESEIDQITAGSDHCPIVMVLDVRMLK